MKKLFKSRKALSPVVAAIILIAVTVAVSIAVAAWMGALTFTFMKTEEVKITGLTWSTDGAPYDNATLAVKNTGSGALTINAATVNDASVSSMTPSSITLQPGDPTSIVLEITNDFVSGTKYTFVLKTATGNQYQYVATAP